MKATKHEPTFETLRRVMFEVACRYHETHGCYPAEVFVSPEFVQWLNNAALNGVKLETTCGNVVRIDGATLRGKPNLRGLTIMCR